MDGAVLAYVQTTTNTNVWLPTLAANPQLNNNTTAGVGGLVNRLRDRIVQTVNGSTTNYTLYGADGSVRAFQVMTFNNGILNQTRPYLQTWTDSRGQLLHVRLRHGRHPAQFRAGDPHPVQQRQLSRALIMTFTATSLTPTAAMAAVDVLRLR